MLTLHPKYGNLGNSHVNPEMFKKLKQKLGFVGDGTRMKNTSTASVEAPAAPPPTQQVCNDEPLPEIYTDTEFRTVCRKEIINNVPRTRPFYLVNNQVARKTSRELSLECFERVHSV